MSTFVVRQGAAAAALRLLLPAFAVVVIRPALPSACTVAAAQAVGDKGAAKDADAAKGNALTPPEHVRARQTRNRAVTVEWSRVPGAASYVITRQAGRNGWQRLYPQDATDTVMVDWNPVMGEPTLYQVAAVDRKGMVGPRTTSKSIVPRDDAGPGDGANGGGAGAGGTPGQVTEPVGEFGMASAMVSVGSHLALRLGETTQARAEANAQWVSLDPGILRVQNDGRVSGVGTGRGQLVAVSRDATGAVRVTVLTVDVDR